MSRAKFKEFLLSRRSDYLKKQNKWLVKFRKKKDKLETKIKKTNNENKKAKITEELNKIDNYIKNIKTELEGDMAEKCLDQIEKMDNVKKVIYQDKMMKITTKNIDVQGHDWGQYIIEIGYVVRIKRKDGFEYEGKCHPFISNNMPCFGIWNPTVNKALNTGGLYTVAMASLRLLTCTNAFGGWYISPSKFWDKLKRWS